jgi:NAD(P)-dependent dehydrogenase (short-subunit alcohol dehydrogenase family)
MKLKGKTALITGSSRGIGRAIALGLAKEGADLVVNYYSENESAKQVVQRVISMGRRAISLQADVGRIEEVQRLVEEAWRFLERIDILVNNAGIVLASSFLDMTEDIWNRTLAVNLKGAFFCSQMVAKKMIDNKIRGKIINVSSANSFQVEIGRSAYNASKGGLDAITLSMAAELGPYGINVSGIAPGYIAGTDIGPKEFLNDDAIQREYLNKIPLERFGQVEDCVGAVVFLASDEASYVQGHTIVIDGGLTIQQIGKVRR